MTSLELLASLLVGAFVGLGALGVGYAAYILAVTVWCSVTGIGRRVVHVRLPADLHRYVQMMRDRAATHR